MNRFSFGLIILVILILAIPVMIILPHFLRYSDKITVSEKTVKRYGTGNTSQEKYLIFTTDGRVFENTDSLLEWKFDSSNVYGKLIPHNTYIVESYGWRVPAISAYQNIINVKLIEEASPPRSEKIVIKESDLIGGPEKEEFVDFDGKRAYLKIDGLAVDTYVKQQGVSN
jgi:hypothetical protein